MKLLVIVYVAFLMLGGVSIAGPYAPAAGEDGSTAIPMNESCFVGWATGYTDYNVGTDVDSEWQDPSEALGKAEGTTTDIVCLGRGGSITMIFNPPIINGPGWDFAVFENSFSNDFLELAYVEVSSDGVNFYRFDNNSLTQDPVAGFDPIDPTNIIGYGGKYRQAFGTPFDLDPDWFYYAGDLSGLDVNNVRYVRIVDIVGDGTCLDTFGNVIYDPYPTVQTAGFDLDAVGVINQAAPIPTLSEWGLIIMMFLLFLIGIVVMRNRQVALP